MFLCPTQKYTCRTELIAALKHSETRQIFRSVYAKYNKNKIYLKDRNRICAAVGKNVSNTCALTIDSLYLYVYIRLRLITSAKLRNFQCKFTISLGVCFKL